MGDIIVMGAGPVGLATAMLVAREGYDVTVLEKDAHATPDSASEAWESWERKGVAQFRSAHYMQAKFRHILDEEFPAVRDVMERSGATRHNIVGAFGATIQDPSPRPGDQRFETITARRPVIESSFARVAEETPGVKVMRGVTVEGVVANGTSNGVPHVVGVRTADGEELRADLVVDAMGRRSKILDLIAGAGGRPPYEEASDAGFTYYTRHYRGTLPETRGTLFTLCSTFAVISVPTDADTWLLVIVCSSDDRALKTAVRQPAAWERVVGSVEHVAHWLDGEPIQEISPMAGVMDRYRRFVVDGQPVVTGLVAVGDAWACTNPQAGRGVSTGLRQAVALRNVLRETPDDPRAIAEAFDRVTEETCTPWYRMQVARDHARYETVKASIEGREPPEPSDPMAQMQNMLNTATAHDPDVARLSLEVFSCLSLPQEIMSRPGALDKVMSAAEGRQPPPFPGPTRAKLLELLSA